MSGWDNYLHLATPKLKVPTELKPTRPNDRGWIIPFIGQNPMWTIPVAIVPALIATILIFMDQQITAVIINRREFKLKVTRAPTLRLLDKARFPLEKTRLPSGLVRLVHHHPHPVPVGPAVVRCSYRLGLDARQRFENHERKQRTW